MPCNTILPWAQRLCFLPREHSAWSRLRVEHCLAPCSVTVMEHVGHTSPWKEQLYAFLVNIPLSRLWCCLFPSPREKQLCSSCFVSRQAWQMRRQSLRTPGLSSEWTEGCPLGYHRGISANSCYFSFVPCWWHSDPCTSQTSLTKDALSLPREDRHPFTPHKINISDDSGCFLKSPSAQSARAQDWEKSFSELSNF